MSQALSNKIPLLSYEENTPTVGTDKISCSNVKLLLSKDKCHITHVLRKMSKRIFKVHLRVFS